MTHREYCEKLLKKNGIEYEVTNYGATFRINGTRNGTEWQISETCSWDNLYQLEYDGYRATRISIKTAIKKLQQL